MGGLQYKEVSATPVSEVQVTSALRWLAAIATDERKRPLVAAVAARDGAMLSIMWATTMRGNEVGSMQLAGLRLADGSSALPKLLPYLTLAPGEEWLIKPMRTKTEKANMVRPRHETEAITVQLVRPMTRNRQGFQETPLKSTALNYVFKRLAEAGVLVGQTPHGIRRGAIQAAGAAGRSPQEAHMVTPGVFQRYRDPVRHLRDR